MDNLFKIIALAALLGVIGVVRSFSVGSGLPENAPPGAVHFAENKKDGTSVTLFERELILETKTDEYTVPLAGIKNWNRSVTSFSVYTNDGTQLYFNFLTLLEAKEFERKLLNLRPSN